MSASGGLVVQQLVLVRRRAMLARAQSISRIPIGTPSDLGPLPSLFQSVS